MIFEDIAKRMVAGAKVLDKAVGTAVETASSHLKTFGDSATAVVTSATESLTGTAITDELIATGKDGPVLITVSHLNEVPLTRERLDLSYAEGGPSLAPYQRVYSVGSTAVDAIQALGARIGWGELADFQDEGDGGSTNPVEAELSGWYYRFTADGTSMKAGGWYVPGGVVLDWWK
jgi:hypothetical protein